MTNQMYDPTYRKPLWSKGKEEVAKEGSLSGERHLHYLYQKGRWEWVLRSKLSALCPTSLCRMVTVEEWPRQDLIKERRKERNG